MVKNLDDAIDQTEHGNPLLRKLIHHYPHEDNPNIGLFEKDQELLDKLKLSDFIEKEKSKSPTLPLNSSRSSMTYKKSAIEKPPIDID
jgi:hypothetical protein